MRALSLTLVALAQAALAAHFYRSGQWALAVVCIALYALVALRGVWARRVLQAALCLGALEWLRTLAAMIALRQGQGAPYVRLTLILLGVAAVNLLAAWLLERTASRPRSSTG